MLTHHIYTNQRIIVVRGAGRSTTAVWRRALDEVRRDAAFQPDFNWVVIGMDRDAIAADAVSEVRDLLYGSISHERKLGFVMPADVCAEVTKAIYRAVSRGPFVRCFSSESAALAWAGWSAGATARPAKPAGVATARPQK